MCIIQFVWRDGKRFNTQAKSTRNAETTTKCFQVLLDFYKKTHNHNTTRDTYIVQLLCDTQKCQKWYDLPITFELRPGLTVCSRSTLNKN